MKKIIIAITIALALLITGCGNKDANLKTYQELSYKQYQEKMKNKDSFILVIGKTGCSACELYEPVINKVIKDYQVKVYHIDTATLTDAEKAEFHQQINYDGTPTTCFIKDGVEQSNSGFNRINGSKEYEYVVDKFKKNGYIK